MTTEALAIHQPEWTDAQKDLIKRTVAPEATDDELAMFLHVAAEAGLDPLQKQIWFLKRWQKLKDRDGNPLLDDRGRPRWEQKVTIMAGADGLQARALRFPDCEGIRYAAVYEKDVFLLDRKTGEVKKHWSNPFNAGKCVGAWAVVDRVGKKPFFVAVRMEEYCDAFSPVWKSKPTTMLEKVARATALRRAYPENFGGIYDPAEFEEREERPALEAARDVAPARPAADPPQEKASQMPPPERQRPADPPREPRVELEEGITRARAAALTVSAAKAQRQQDESDADVADLLARARKTGIPQQGLRSWVESMIGRKLPEENGWSRLLAKEDRDVLREELAVRDETVGRTGDPKTARPKKAPPGPIVDTVKKSIVITDRDGSTHTVTTEAPV